MNKQIGKMYKRVSKKGTEYQAIVIGTQRLIVIGDKVFQIEA